MVVVLMAVAPTAEEAVSGAIQPVVLELPEV